MGRTWRWPAARRRSGGGACERGHWGDVERSLLSANAFAKRRSCAAKGSHIAVTGADTSPRADGATPARGKRSAVV